MVALVTATTVTEAHKMKLVKPFICYIIVLLLACSAFFYFAYGMHLLGVANHGFAAFPEAWERNTMLYFAFWSIEAIGLFCTMVSILLIYAAAKFVLRYL